MRSSRAPTRPARALPRARALVLAAGVAAALAAPGAARAQPFTQCPTVGANPTCGALITVGPGGVISLAVDPALGPYDGSDDALVGIVNRSGFAISSINLTATGLDIFGFDGDGLCTYVGFCASRTYPAGYRPNGYEGPVAWFSNINASGTSGTVNFLGGLADGASTYFSLENTPQQIANANPGGTVTPGVVPEPGTVALVGAGLVLAGAAARRRACA